jgi:hypothetical protein
MPTTLFGTAQLDDIVAQTLASSQLPAGHTNAVIVATDATGASVVASFTLGDADQWQVQGYFRHDLTSGDNTAGARVVYSW